jgi:hypothetical protein
MAILAQKLRKRVEDFRTVKGEKLSMKVPTFGIQPLKRKIFIDNSLVQIHHIIVMIR